MIVNEGKLRLLGWQVPQLETCFVVLFTNDETITGSTTWSDLVEAAWVGYARAEIGALVTPYLVAGRATTQAVDNPVFENTSGVGRDFYGWAVLDTTDNVLLAAENIGLTTLPNGGSYILDFRYTDTEEP